MNRVLRSFPRGSADVLNLINTLYTYPCCNTTCGRKGMKPDFSRRKIPSHEHIHLASMSFEVNFILQRQVIVDFTTHTLLLQSKMRSQRHNFIVISFLLYIHHLSQYSNIRFSIAFLHMGHSAIRSPQLWHVPCPQRNIKFLSLSMHTGQQVCSLISKSCCCSF